MSPLRRRQTYCFSRISSSYGSSLYFTHGPSLPWLHGSWFYNYLCNQCLSPLILWVRILIMARCTALCDKVCQWLPTGWWFSSGPPVSSTNKTDLHDITEILLKVALSTIKQINKQKHVFTKSCSGCYQFIFWNGLVIFGMKVCDHQPVCDVSSRPSNNVWNQGQIINFLGIFLCVACSLFYLLISIYDLWHEGVLPSANVSRISMFFTGPWSSTSRSRLSIRILISASTSNNI